MKRKPKYEIYIKMTPRSAFRLYYIKHLASSDKAEIFIL